MGTRKKSEGFAVCVRNRGHEESLEVRKLYLVVSDSEAESHGLMRVVDESGDDYLYPSKMFERVALPGEVERALRRAS